MESRDIHINHLIFKLRDELGYCRVVSDDLRKKKLSILPVTDEYSALAEIEINKAITENSEKIKQLNVWLEILKREIP